MYAIVPVAFKVTCTHSLASQHRASFKPDWSGPAAAAASPLGYAAGPPCAYRRVGPSPRLKTARVLWTVSTAITPYSAPPLLVMVPNGDPNPPRPAPTYPFPKSRRRPFSPASQIIVCDPLWVTWPWHVCCKPRLVLRWAGATVATTCKRVGEDQCISGLDLRNGKALHERFFIDRCLLTTSGCRKRRRRSAYRLWLAAYIPMARPIDTSWSSVLTNSRRLSTLQLAMHISLSDIGCETTRHIG